MSKKSVLLLSGYHAASHSYWTEQLAAGLQSFDWTVLALPDRHFYWRIRSNAMTFALQHGDTLRSEYSLIVATSMVDLCNLRGLVPSLADVPAVLYFHENQFVYPQRHSGPQHKTRDNNKPNSNLINAQLTTVFSAMSAQHLVFNSCYNRDSYFAGAETLFDKMPDGTTVGFLNSLRDNSSVIPVPVRGPTVQTRSINADDGVEIVWNHRWEYDKQPEVFFDALEQLIEQGIKCRVHVMGQSFREVPDAFAAFKERYGDHIATWGYQPTDEYRRVLNRAHIVVSSALHDFQGLGMLEAIAAGCIPVAPDRMAYPEYIPPSLLYKAPSAGAAVRLEADALCQKLVSLVLGQCASAGPITVDQYLLEQVLPKYSDRFSSLIDAAN